MSGGEGQLTAWACARRDEDEKKSNRRRGRDFENRKSEKESKRKGSGWRVEELCVDRESPEGKKRRDGTNTYSSFKLLLPGTWNVLQQL